jgi:hypothetical protein
MRELPSLTLGEMRDILLTGVPRRRKTILLNIHHSGVGFLEVNRKLVLDAFDELTNKIPIVQSGLDEFTASEKLLFQLLHSHCENG